MHVKKLSLIFSSIIFNLGFAVVAHAERLTPPAFNFQNHHQVNLVSGHVSPSLTDVTIGGALGLTHSISSYTSNFVTNNSSTWGYNDSYRGGVYKMLHHPQMSIDPEFKDLWVLNAHGGGSSADFLINSDGDTFTALGDKRDTLEFVNTPGFMGYEHTTPDGTVIRYKSYTANHDHRSNQPLGSFQMTEIKHPNGFTISINHKSNGQFAPIASVTTNTGFQLKYVYQINRIPSYVAATSSLPAADSVNWSDINPKYIYAINNAVDYCTTEPNDFTKPVSDACPAFTRQWPTVTYEWPNGMPRAMYLGAGVFKITDAMGGVTEYRHTPHSAYIPGVMATDPHIYVPRLTSIKDSRSTGTSINYSYRNVSQTANGFDWSIHGQAGPVGQLERSWIGADSAGYVIGAPGQYDGFSTNGGGGHNPVAVSSYALTGIYKVETRSEVINMEMSHAQRVIRIDKKFGAGSIVFGYDARGNLITRTENGITTNAEYPSSCSSYNRKYCNQAMWISDGKGNRTDYTYHPESGQVATVTQPADDHGIRPQTRYTYEQKYAWYKNASGNFQQASSPIWLLTRESFCKTGAGTSNGCALGGDEVVTEYDYGPAQGPNNLFLRGVAVTADGETRRTCYQYDVYGNRIGESQPKAGLSYCE